MSAGNPFFGQQLVSLSQDRTRAEINFPNWGITDEDHFKLLLNGRMKALGFPINPRKTRRGTLEGNDDPTLWVIEAK